MPRAGRSKAIEGKTYAAASRVMSYSLRLYIAGSSLKSTRAIQVVSDLCASLPRGLCKFEVIDLYQQPDLARQDNIIAVPSLVKIHPPPRRAFIGITEDKHRILRKLGIPVTQYGSLKTKTR